MTGAQVVMDGTSRQETHDLSRRVAALRDYLFSVRRQSGFDRYDAIVLAVYAAVLAFAIHHYLPFADEAQEWLIARDSSLHEMLFRRLHYEGHPALWALILWVVARLHLPYAGINWMAGAFAAPGIYLLLRYSPFPRIFRWLLPFTFFLQYQYAVVARPYVFVPALLFGMCIAFTAERPRPVLFGLLAGLLANISLHAAIVAAVFCVLYLHELRLRRKRSGTPIPVRPAALGIAVFCLLATCSVTAAFPAPDAVIATRPDETAIQPSPMALRLMGQESLPATAPPLDKSLYPTAEKISDNARAASNAYPWIVRKAVITTILGVSAALFPLSSSSLLATVTLGVVSLWLWARGCPRLMLAFFVPVAFSVQILVLPHHTGIFLLSLISAAWIALNEQGGNALMRERLPWIQSLLAPVALPVLLLQVGWSRHCVESTLERATDPGRQTAAFLSARFPNASVAGYGFESVSAQPYVLRNLYFNWPHTYWVWSANVFVDRRRTEVLQQHPDAIVLDDFATGDDSIFNQWLSLMPIGDHPFAPMAAYWRQHGYTETHRFCGYRPSREGLEDSLCEVVMEPSDAIGSPR